MPNVFFFDYKVIVHVIVIYYGAWTLII